MVEVRITRIAKNDYEVTFVIGLLNTYTEQKHFASVAEAKNYINSKIDTKNVPIIVQ